MIKNTLSQLNRKSILTQYVTVTRNLSSASKKYPLHKAAKSGDIEAIISCLHNYNVKNKIQLDHLESSERSFFCSLGFPLALSILYPPVLPIAIFMAFFSRTAEVENRQEKLRKKQIKFVNQLDNNGSTPLHHAVNQGHLDAAKILIEWGAHVDLKNKDGKEPQDLTEDNAMDRAIQKIQQELINAAPNSSGLDTRLKAPPVKIKNLKIL